jgi:hypothetical protein
MLLALKNRVYPLFGRGRPTPGGNQNGARFGNGFVVAKIRAVASAGRKLA